MILISEKYQKISILHLIQQLSSVLRIFFLSLISSYPRVYIFYFTVSSTVIPKYVEESFSEKYHKFLLSTFSSFLGFARSLVKFLFEKM